MTIIMLYNIKKGYDFQAEALFFIQIGRKKIIKQKNHCHHTKIINSDNIHHKVVF